jgi:hypothetical protein
MISFLHKAIHKATIVLIFFIAIFAIQSSYAQIKFSAICPEKKIGKNDLLQIQFKIENAKNVETIIPPSFKNFEVVSGPNQQSGMTSINGKIDQYIAISFFLQPKSTGKFSIGSAIARADGKKFFSNPIVVEVTAASASSPNNNPGNSLSPFSNFNFDFPAPPPTHQFDDFILKTGESPAEKIKKNLFIKLEVSKTHCFVGEPITASYKLYTRLRSESSITDAPSFNGFSVSDLDVNNNSSIEKYNGRQYNVYVLRKVQLYPLQPGNFTLDPLVANNKVTFIKAAYAGTQQGEMFFDMLENFADATSPENAVVDETVTLKSEPVTIKVKPLPAQNIPKEYKGAVGNFTIQAKLEKNNFTTDDAGILRVVISGQGNIQLINSPRINWPENIEGFEAKVTDNIDKSSVPMKGSKTFTFPFTVANAGKYKIDSISFSYFDPASSSYKIIKTAPLQVQVNKGTGVPNNPYVNASKSPVNKSFASVHTYELTAGIILISGIILLIIWGINRKNKSKDLLGKNVKVDDIKNKIKENEPEFIIPENPLLAAHEKLIADDRAQFYNVLDASLKKYLSAKLKIPVEEITKKRVNEELDKCNVGLGTSLMLNSLLEEIEMNLYAMPAHGNHLKSTFEKASEVVSLLDKQVC